MTIRNSTMSTESIENREPTMSSESNSSCFPTLGQDAKKLTEVLINNRIEIQIAYSIQLPDPPISYPISHKRLDNPQINLVPSLNKFLDPKDTNPPTYDEAMEFPPPYDQLSLPNEHSFKTFN